MGFLDRAKQMAEQAQAKLDEAQKQFNAGQQKGESSGPAVEYDKHGRPVPQAEAESSSPPQGDPLAGAVAKPAPEAPAAPPAAETPSPSPQAAEPPVEDRNHPSYAPPKLTSGDPLAG
jgi:hypothetical protein